MQLHKCSTSTVTRLVMLCNMLDSNSVISLTLCVCMCIGINSAQRINLNDVLYSQHVIIIFLFY